MKKFLVLLTILTGITIIGLYQNTINTVGIGCSKYNASQDFNGYKCKDQVYYIEK